ncbi:hypothetical protein DYL59_31090 [Pseudomonas kairouanensis]|uniref:Uncharacterized protein n=1 Tax=Pseudomonas kairouanensis TaxID=2293832 RepID=A0A4Z0AAE7_9PSED|nr:hypothetical protein DYL59_31090 [Pseudomonas kairouanensis]
MLAKLVNDSAGIQNDRGVLTVFASKLAPTVLVFLWVTEIHCRSSWAPGSVKPPCFWRMPVYIAGMLIMPAR